MLTETHNADVFLNDEMCRLFYVTECADCFQRMTEMLEGNRWCNPQPTFVLYVLSVFDKCETLCFCHVFPYGICDLGKVLELDHHVF